MRSTRPKRSRKRSLAPPARKTAGGAILAQRQLARGAPQLCLRCARRARPAQDGRWTRRDPIGIKGEVDLYAFGNNIPTQIFDRLGKDLYAIDGTNYDYGKSGNVAKFYDWYQGMSDSLYNS